MWSFLSKTCRPISLHHPYQDSRHPQSYPLQSLLQGSFFPGSYQHHARQSCHAGTDVFSIHRIQMLSQHSKLTCILGNSITTFFPRNRDRNDRNPSTFLARFLYKFCQPLQTLTTIRKFLFFITLYQDFPLKSFQTLGSQYTFARPTH